MNPLPQRKKTAEEIAKLREEFMPLAPSPAAAEKSPAPAAIPTPTASAPRPPVEAKPVRSLRKSERGPSSSRSTPSSRSGNSAIPVQRRSEEEINRLRRAQVGTDQSPAAHLIALTAHPAIVAAGYFSVITAALLPIIDWLWTNVSFHSPAILSGAGLIIAGFIFLKKKRSLHHAGFIAAIEMFVIIFGALYYFPQLRNAP